MIVTIPSYKRAGAVTTLDMLQGGFSKDEIVLGTQTESDYKEYSRLYGDRCIVIYEHGECCADNRNSLLKYCQQRGIKETLQLDDDLRHIRTKNDRKLKGREFRQFIEKVFEKARANDILLWGGYITDNRCSMSLTAKRNIIVGMLTGILDTSIRYDNAFKIKEDYELSLRLMQQGKRVIRFNSFAAVAAHKTSGGCEEWWKRSDNKVFADWLVQAYPQLVTYHPTRKGEIKFIG